MKFKKNPLILAGLAASASLFPLLAASCNNEQKDDEANATKSQIIWKINNLLPKVQVKLNDNVNTKIESALTPEAFVFSNYDTNRYEISDLRIVPVKYGKVTIV
ncbi:variable surface lipoprotein [Mycoplasmopsis gallinarum]|uniref:Lipoprotein n=2 Tax=Mycoplasmopsis gallinarum TaxID=29557 RepID=A0A168RH56_9BACT|nr:variable surface lipoprotein [Mycoplasmopsis gallinarum]OAB48981.1 hypothetical protein MGALLINA_03130 [Mycoplasmopsis gallinarum]